LTLEAVGERMGYLGERLEFGASAERSEVSGRTVCGLSPPKPPA
jgi:hypothetical protein